MQTKPLFFKHFPLLKYFSTTVLHIFIATIAIQTAYSYDCDSPSPSYNDGKTPFDYVQVRNLSHSEKDDLKRLFISLSGQWRGEAEDIECKGSSEELSKKNSFFSICAKVKTDRDGNLRIENELFSEEKKSRHSEITEFYIVDNKLRFDTDSSAGDIELVDMKKDKIEFIKRNIATPWGGGPVRREIFVTLSVQAHSFIIEKIIYTNGRYTSTRIRNFKK